MWKDIQLSKGQLNKKRLISADVAGEIYYSSAPCLGVKVCLHKELCDYVVSIRDKRCCPKHNLPLERTSGCPVEFVYVHPKDPNDKRWMGGLVRCQKDPSDNLHNHLLHGASKISQCIKSKIDSAVTADPSLTPSDIASGKGLYCSFLLLSMVLVVIQEKCRHQQN